MILEDTTYKAIVRGEFAEMWRNEGKCMMTDNLRGFYYKEIDTLFAKADSVYVYFDTLTNEVQDIKAFYNVRFFRNDIQGKCDSLHYNVADSMVYMRDEPVIWAEDSQLTGDSINIKVKVPSPARRNMPASTTPATSCGSCRTAMCSSSAGGTPR